MIATTLRQSPLFRDLSDSEIQSLIETMNGRMLAVSKHQTIYRPSDPARWIFIVLTGSVLAFHDDLWGNRHTVANFPPGEIFGLPYAILPGATMNLTATASEESTILFLDVLRILYNPGLSPLCPALSRNLTLILAEKLADGVEHLAHMNHRTTRDKLLSYLSAEARRQRSCTFTVPFNRQQLADYLGVQRAAMCAELSRMQKDGLIEYHRNRFTFLTVDQLL